MTTSAGSSRFETYTKEQLLYFYGIVNILLIYVYNIATVGWQLIHYTVYGTKKSDNGLGFASSIIAFLRPVNCIMDLPPSNICIIMTRYHWFKRITSKHVISCRNYIPLECLQTYSLQYVGETPTPPLLILRSV